METTTNILIGRETFARKRIGGVYSQSAEMIDEKVSMISVRSRRLT